MNDSRCIRGGWSDEAENDSLGNQALKATSRYSRDKRGGVGNAAKQGRRQAQSTYSERRKDLQKITPSQRTLRNQLLARCSLPVFSFSPEVQRRLGELATRDNGQARDLLTEVSILLDGESVRIKKWKRTKSKTKQEKGSRKDRRTLAKVNVIDWRFFQAGH